LTGDDSPMATLLLNMMGSFAEFELAWSRERQREGIEVAKRAGVYKGRKRLLTPERSAELARRLGGGESKAALAREFGMDRTTIYRYIGRAAAKPESRVRQGSDTPRSRGDALFLWESKGAGLGTVLNLLHVETAG
jgi:DNA invertase Pin-like site-specific DNA recombinase